MQPLGVLNAIVFGSAAAIAFGLASVLFIFLLLQGKHSELATEFIPLLRSSLLFTTLAAIAGISLYASLKRLRWRWIAQAVMWFTVLGVGMFYWPT
ncbi:MAG TPA: hypothetical protein VJS42_02620 [Steroidobacteraceae bacterium]|nr:hypothetical protein [Steroidobacteraceae bacterium]